MLTKTEEQEEQRYLEQLNFRRLSHVLETGESRFIWSDQFGNISVDKGIAGKNGYGLLHIIENRTNEGRNEEETAAIIHLVTQAAKEGWINREIADKNNPEKIRRVELEKDGIIALISLHRNHNEEKWVLTGFDNRNKKEEAAEAIRTVIAQHGQSPDFSYFRKQVGAAVSSLKISQENNELSREIETARKAGYVQGVCECVAAIGDDHALCKKLLTEMNVNRDMARKFANPETYKKLEQGIFAPKPEQEQTQNIKR